MAVNIKVRSKFDIDTATDSMGRTWTGWDEDASDQDNWDHNRGRHTFSDRVDDERYATSGDLRLYAWEPEQEDLVPLDYDFYCRAHGMSPMPTSACSNGPNRAHDYLEGRNCGSEGPDRP